MRRENTTLNSGRHDFVRRRLKQDFCCELENGNSFYFYFLRSFWWVLLKKHRRSKPRWQEEQCRLVLMRVFGYIKIERKVIGRRIFPEDSAGRGISCRLLCFWGSLRLYHFLFLFSFFLFFSQIKLLRKLKRTP